MNNNIINTIFILLFIMFYEVCMSQDELNLLPDHGKHITPKKMLINGPNLEEFNGNEALLSYDKWIMPYNSDFPNFINKEFDEFTLTPMDNIVKITGDAFKYQQFIKKYIEYGTPYRGILLHQGLGSGKTRTCIMASETFRRAKIPIIFIGPATLRANFINELLVWGDDDIKLTDKKNTALREHKIDIINKSYSFISSNAHNVLVQLAKIGIGHHNIYDNLADPGVAKYLAKNPGAVLNYPHNCLIILEEAHNLNQKFSSVSAKTAKRLFSILYNSVDCKFIALTGTPIINKPFEICSLFNLLKGPMVDGSSLLPMNIEEFKSKYMDEEGNIINKIELQTRILGLVSYYKGINSDRNLYPDLIHHPIISVSMSEGQNAVHDFLLQREMAKFLDKKDMSTRLTELIEEAKRKEEEEFMSDKSSANSYRIYSRAACNFTWKIDDDDVEKPIINIPYFIFHFKDFSYKNIDCLKICFFKNKLEPEKDQDIITKINNFPFSTSVKFNWYDYIMNPLAKIELVKDILTCAVLYTYFGISRVPKIIDDSGSSTKFRKIDNSSEMVIYKYLTLEDQFNISEILKTPKQRLTEAINKLIAGDNTYFSNDGLAQHSPKMLAIYNNIISGEGSLKICKDKIIHQVGELDELGLIKTTNKYDNIDIDIIDDDDINDDIDDDINDDIDDDINEDSLDDEVDVYEYTNDHIIFIKDNLINNECISITSIDALFYKLKTIDNKKFISDLLKTDNKYLIHTSLYNIYKHKYYIKGKNIYGTGLMMFRDYLNGKKESIINFDSGDINIINYPETYDTVSVNGGPALVYSEFNNAEGIAIFSKILDYNGYRRFNPDMYDYDDININDFSPKYAVITGNVSMDHRQEIIKYFNHSLNKNGQFIGIILGTSAASEGISLKYIRQVHIMEPFWHNIKIQQVIGRARRLFSHAALPIDERVVHIFKYIAESNTILESTDSYLNNLANRKDKMIKEINNILIEASVDCSLNNTDVKCFKTPINKKGVPAFKLGENLVVDKIIKKDEDFTMKFIKGFGAYKINDAGIPIEKKLYLIDIAMNNKYYDKYMRYNGKEMFLFPLYDYDKVLYHNDFVIVLYGHLLQNGNLVVFTKSMLSAF